MAQPHVAAKHARHRQAMLAVMGLLCLWGIFSGDRMPLADGFGWDGQTYAAIAANPRQALLVQGQTAYHWQKVLPGLLVHAGLLLAPPPITPPRIVMGFLILNSFMLLGATVLYNRLADFLRWEVPARWLGFCLLFLNVNAVKAGFYYAVLTDITALALGLAMVTFYLTSRTAALAATTLLASFTWGTALPLGACLLLFPVAGTPPYDKPGLSATGTVLPKILAALFTLLIIGRMGYLFQYQDLRGIGYGALVPVVEVVFPLSLLCTATAIYAVLAWFFSLLTPANIKDALASLSARHLLLVVALGLPVKVISAWLAKGEYYFTVGRHFEMVIFQSTTRPAVFLVAHFLAFGPIIAVLPLVLRRTANLLASWGPGAVLFTVLSLATLISPESRHGVLGYPFLAVAVMIAFEKTGKVHSSLVWGLAAASLVMSRVWQRFDTGLVDSRGAPDVSRYFATQGMQLPNWDYLMGLFVLVTMAMAVAGSMPSRGPGASMVRASSANPRCSDGEAATTPEEAAADPEA